jgi:glucose/arabinose dehydrogenase
MRYWIIALALFTFAAPIAQGKKQDQAQHENQAQSQQGPGQFKVAFENLEFNRPIFFAAPANDGENVFVAEQRGMIYRFKNRPAVTKEDRKVVLDIRDRVRSPADDKGKNEEGFLGMAFHPDFAENHKVYTDHTAYQGKRRNVISEWQYNPETGKIDPDSQRILMEIPQPFWNHDGGGLAFGPKGYLYITKGDGGSGGDPKENGQDLSTLLGAILRIDVDNQENDKAYAIPDSNPFVDRENARPEVYALGLRNVWRFSFDEKTGTLWAGDVGQNEYEEVDRLEKGGNYGWDIREGLHPFEGDEKHQAKLIDPVVEYPHDKGVSITGGYVYRGEDVPELQGQYIYGDYGSGRVWALRFENTQEPSTRQFDQVPAIASFGQDRENELYICSFDGHIYKLRPTN